MWLSAVINYRNADLYKSAIDKQLGSDVLDLR